MPERRIAIKSRYREAYRLAQVARRVAGWIRSGAEVLGVCVLVFAALVAMTTQGRYAIGIAVLGATACVALAVAGLVLDLLAHLLRAQLDTAINTSPFISAEDMIDVLSHT